MMTSSTAERTEAFAYGDDAIARLTGLTLDPETPLHMKKETQRLNGTTEEQDGHHAVDDVEGKKEMKPRDPNEITLRSLVSSKEAGVVIGKGGKNVAEVREATNVRAGVSKVIQGVHERILSVTGHVDSVAKAYALIAKHLFETPLTPAFQPSAECAHIRLLLSHQMMGSVIGKGGSKIREIQETTGTKIVVSKEMLPQSTERVIEMYGSVEAIEGAVKQIGDCVVQDANRAVGAILYNPQVRLGGGIASVTSRQPLQAPRGGVEDPLHRPYYTQPASRPGRPISGNYAPFEQGKPRFAYRPSESRPAPDTSEYETRQVPIPAGMVGCIIGKGGYFINQIREASGSRISISKLTDPATNNRTFTVMGTPESNEKALQMLYKQLDSERERRMNATEKQDN